MGADIHFVIEQRTPENEWYGVYYTGGPVTCPPYQFTRRDVGGGSLSGPIDAVGPLGKLKQRNYDLFAELAGVRGEGPAPLGLPDGLSVMAREAVKRRDNDSHSHSWLSLRDFVMAAIRNGSNVGGAALEALNGKHPALEFLNRQTYGVQVDIEDLADFRVVFWFDN